MAGTVVVGLLGNRLEQGGGPARRERWPARVDLCLHEEARGPCYRVQLADAISVWSASRRLLRGRTPRCRASRTPSEAGRRPSTVSPKRRSKPGDADRQRNHLQHFGLDWTSVTEPPTGARR